MDTRPDWGRGRIDPFNPVKFGFLKLPVDDTIGNSDMEPVWNQKPRQGMLLHWDGLNTNHTAVLSSALGDGATKKWVDRDFQNWRNGSSLQKIEKYLMEVQARSIHFPSISIEPPKGKSSSTGTAPCAMPLAKSVPERPSQSMRWAPIAIA